MKNINLIKHILLISFMLMFILVPNTNSFCAVVPADSWDVQMKSKITIPGEVTARDKTSGVSFLYTNGTFEVYEDDWGILRTYSGTYDRVKSGEKEKLLLTLDSSGENELNDMMTDWVYELASEGDVNVSDLSIEFTKIEITPAIISKKTGKPNRAKMFVKGILTGYKNGKFITKRINYQNTIIFESISQP